MAKAKGGKPQKKEAPNGAVKRGRGQPTKYRPEFVRQAERLALLGATDQEMADFFEVTVRTLYRWRNDRDDFCHALKQAKDVADTRVERSLYQMAIGYEQDEVKIFMPAGSPTPVYAPFRAKVAPNVTAAIFWLKNRQRDQWRDKPEGEGAGDELTGALRDLIGKLPG